MVGFAETVSLLVENVTIMIMSGVDDGQMYDFRPDTDGEAHNDQWRLTIGRREENDLCLKKDTYVSRNHAALHWRDNQWWLEDKNSTNGTFMENARDFFNDIPVFGTVPLGNGQLFRVGRTWLLIQVG